MRLYLWLLTPLFETWLFIQYELSIVYLLFVLLTFGAIVYVDHRKIRPLLAGWWLYIYLLCSFLVIAAFKFTPTQFSLGIKNITEKSFVSLAESAIVVMMCYFLSLLFFYKKKSGKKNPSWTNYYPKFNSRQVLIVGYSLTIASLVLGIGRMGAENARLPFHLTGIIQFCRTDVIPILILCIYVDYKKNNKKLINILIVFFVWTLLESVVRMSKSAIMFSFLPIVMYEFISGTKINKTIKSFLPLGMVILILYPIIGTLRGDESGKVDVEFCGTFNNPEANNIIVQPFNRTFVSGVLFCIDEKYVDSNSFFDFRRAPLIILSGGSSRYQTYTIDGYGENVFHSSGTSPFIDSFLMGGYGLMYLSVLLMAFIASRIDTNLNKKTNFIVMAIVCVGYFRLFDMPLITFLLNEMSVRYLVVYFGACLYIYKSWKKKN